MKRLEIQETNNTPHILLDIENEKFIVEGKSFPEDSKEFYRPVIEWLEAFKASAPKNVKFCFNLFYLSSSSVISVKQFFMKVVELAKSGTSVTVEWSYDEDDDDIKKIGEDYQKITKLDFEYKVNE